jgi:hypothetical protein
MNGWGKLPQAKEIEVSIRIRMLHSKARFCPVTSTVSWFVVDRSRL